MLVMLKKKTLEKDQKWSHRKSVLFLFYLMCHCICRLLSWMLILLFFNYSVSTLSSVLSFICGKHVQMHFGLLLQVTSYQGMTYWLLFRGTVYSTEIQYDIWLAIWMWHWWNKCALHINTGKFLPHVSGSCHSQTDETSTARIQPLVSWRRRLALFLRGHKNRE